VTPCAITPPQFFSDYSFLVHHPVNRDDQKLLAHAMASDFTVAWQFSQREQFFMNQTPCPYPTRSLSAQLFFLVEKQPPLTLAGFDRTTLTLVGCGDNTTTPRWQGKYLFGMHFGRATKMCLKQQH
jgi:hypothetical protein